MKLMKADELRMTSKEIAELTEKDMIIFCVIVTH